MNQVKKYVNQKTTKAAENAIALGNLQLIGSKLVQPLPANPLLYQKLVNQNYSNRHLVQKIGNQNYELLQAKYQKYPDYSQFKNRDLLIYVLEHKPVTEFVMELAGKSKVNDSLVFRHLVNNNLDLALKNMPSTGDSKSLSELLALLLQDKNSLGEYKISNSQVSLMIQSAYARQSNLQETLKLHKQLRTTKFQELSFTNLIKCMSQRQMNGDAINEYKKLRRDGVATNAQMYESLIRVSSLSKSVSWFHKHDLKKSMGMYGAMIDKYFENNEPLLGYKMLKEALKYSKKRSMSSRTHIPYSICSGVLKELENNNLAQFQEFTKLAGFSDSQLSLLVAKLMFYSTNNPELTLALYQLFDNELKNILVPNKAHVAAIQAYGNLGKVEEAQAIFDKAIDGSFEYEPEFYGSLMRVYSQIKNEAKVTQLHQEMKQNGISDTIDTFESRLAVSDNDSILREMQDAMVIPSKEYPLVFEAMKDQLVSPRFLNMQ